MRLDNKLEHLIRTQRCKKRKNERVQQHRLRLRCDRNDATRVSLIRSRLSRSHPCSLLRNYYYYYIFTFVFLFLSLLRRMVVAVFHFKRYYFHSHGRNYEVYLCCIYCIVCNQKKILSLWAHRKNNFNFKRRIKTHLKEPKKKEKIWSWYAETRARSISAESLAVEILFHSTYCGLLCNSAKATERNQRSKRETFIKINSRETLAVCEM